MSEIEQVIKIFPKKLRELLAQADTLRFQVQELRLRSGQPLLMKAGGEEWYLSKDGGMWIQAEIADPARTAKSVSAQYLDELDIRKREKESGSCYQVTVSDIRDTLEYMSRYSLYAFDEELRQGFLTIPGGHRIGVAGQVVTEGRKVKALMNVSFLNVRVARQVRGCADPVLPLIYEKGRLCSCLVVSPPGCGKTTILRDMIRQVSDGWLDREHGTWIKGMTVGVVDERSELAACCQGKPQNDLGIRTDVLDGCPKAEGMMMLIRSMAPQVVAVDEIGSREDLEAIRYSKNCGCLLLATAHGISLEDIQKKPVLQEFAAEGVFERIIVLESRGMPGQVKAITDGAGQPVG